MVAATFRKLTCMAVLAVLIAVWGCAGTSDKTSDDVASDANSMADTNADTIPLADTPADLAGDQLVPTEVSADSLVDSATDLADDALADAVAEVTPDALPDLHAEVSADTNLADSGEVEEPCPDSDFDTICDDVDICPGGNDTIDTDGDGTPNDCDECSSLDDSDGDGVVDDCDDCPGFNDSIDGNENGVPDGCEACYPNPCKYKEHSSCDPFTGTCDCKDGWCDIDDICLADGENHPDSGCLFCDLDAEPTEWSVRPAESLCRGAVGPCDMPEACDGENPACPADEFTNPGTECGASEDPCSGADTCDGMGSCLSNNLDLGTVCGDSDDLCLLSDTCDGEGSCLDNGFSPIGTFCGEGPGECSAQDACDGEGFCIPNHFDEGHPCGDTGTECRAQDVCDGAGLCADMGVEEAGSLCGVAPSECSAQDSCDGEGNCAANDEPAGSPCGDAATECVLQDTCDTHGQCDDNGFAEASTPCGEPLAQCSEEDTCDEAGNCLPLDLQAGSPCDDDQPSTYNDQCHPDLSCSGEAFSSCLKALEGGLIEDGIYWLDLDGPGPGSAVEAWCDMTNAGGGWMLVAVYGDSGRPEAWSGAAFPRPGASYYGELSGAIFDVEQNNVDLASYSTNASALWSLNGADVMLYVGGNTDSYAMAHLPGGCNPFDSTTVCQENTWGPFPLFAADGTRLSDNGYACTTAHGQPPFEQDPYDEFGLQLLDGLDGAEELHCNQGSSSLGHQGLGRVFVTLESSSGSGWDHGVHSHWALTGDYNQPGALLIRESTDCLDGDFDGICTADDLCPNQYDPEQEDANDNSVGDRCEFQDCLAIREAGAESGDGLYWIDPDGAHGNEPVQVYCNMSEAGGGWTLAAIYGTDERPAEWTGNSYPRPGASNYGALATTIFDWDENDGEVANYSLDVGLSAGSEGVEIMAYVGGTTDDFVVASLPGGCNFFDGESVCAENSYGPFFIYRSDGRVATETGYACTTAHGGPGFEADPHDEFGLHLLDGGDSSVELHCNVGAGGGGHEGMGRIFATLEESSGAHWATGVDSHWNGDGQVEQPGALFVRRANGCNDNDLDGICDEADSCPYAQDPKQLDDNDNGTGDACEPRDCLTILQNGGSPENGIYWIDPDGPGGEPAHPTLCAMSLAGGGWSAAAIYGLDGRPSEWSGNDYPRPGASYYGKPTTAILSQASNDCCIGNFSLDASPMWTDEGLEILLWAGGSTDDFAIVTLPPECNVFDGTMTCPENVLGPLEVRLSDGSLLTDQAYACTTAHGGDPFTEDPFDEFGLQLVDGLDGIEELHCNRGSTDLGHENLGRIFATLEASKFFPSPWTQGLVSHWSETGETAIPGALFVRSPDADCKDPDSDFVCDDVDNCPGLPNGNQKDGDEDGVGDACDSCVEAHNPDQLLEVDPVDGECKEGFVRYVRDQDNDGFPLPDQVRCLCQLPVEPGWIPEDGQDGDCDDTKATVYPGAPEQCNGLDDDCDLETDEEGPLLDEQCPPTYPKRYVDADKDGYGVVGGVPRCLCAGDGLHTSTHNSDCNDTDDAVKPNAKETCATEYDDNCNGDTNDKNATDCALFYRDVDKDGYGGSGACYCVATATYFLPTSTDCNDSKSGVNPGAKENCSTGDDDDCDGDTNDKDALNCKQFYWDDDMDGYYPSGAPSKCLCKGYGQVSATKPGDCCGTDNASYPGAPYKSYFKTACGNYDYNCDGKETLQATAVMKLKWNYAPEEGQFTTCVYKYVYCDGMAEVESAGWLGAAPACGQKGAWVGADPQYYHMDECWCYFYVFGCDGPYCDWKSKEQYQECQ
jgi:hypothetical protein